MRKSASWMILYIVDSYCAHTLYSTRLQYGHNQNRFTVLAGCAMGTGQHLLHLYMCKRFECKIKGSPCLHTSTLCSNCRSTIYKGNSSERNINIAATNAAAARLRPEPVIETTTTTRCYGQGREDILLSNRGLYTTGDSLSKVLRYNLESIMLLTYFSSTIPVGKL